MYLQPTCFTLPPAQLLDRYHFPHISDIYFSSRNQEALTASVLRDGQVFKGATGTEVRVGSCTIAFDANTHADTQVRVHFSLRDPATFVGDASKLVVAMFAWDSNSYVGIALWPIALCGSWLSPYHTHRQRILAWYACGIWRPCSSIVLARA
jgi:hypothetical protein